MFNLNKFAMTLFGSSPATGACSPPPAQCWRSISTVFPEARRVWTDRDLERQHRICRIFFEMG